MSQNTSQPLKCSNLHISDETLCELVGALKSLQSVISSIQPIISSIQPIISSIQPIISSIQPIVENIQPTSKCDPYDLRLKSSLNQDSVLKNGTDGMQGDIKEEYIVDPATQLRCPHPECALKSQIYTKDSSLQRHYNYRGFSSSLYETLSAKRDDL